MDTKTPDNFNYGDMTADFRMKYKTLMEKQNTKKNNKKQKPMEQSLADQLYGGNK